MKNVKVEDLLNIKCVWRYVCVAVGALAGVVLFGCDSSASLIDPVKNSKFKSFDEARTLEQAFKENPFIKSLDWKVVNLENGDRVVVATFTNESFPSKEDLKEKEGHDFRDMMIRSGVMNNSSEISFTFIPSKDSEPCKLKKISLATNKGNIAKSIEKMKAEVEKRGYNNPEVFEKLKKEIEETDFSETRATTNEADMNEMLGKVYKKKSLFADF